MLIGAQNSAIEKNLMVQKYKADDIYIFFMVNKSHKNNTILIVYVYSLFIIYYSATKNTTPQMTVSI